VADRVAKHRAGHQANDTGHERPAAIVVTVVAVVVAVAIVESVAVVVAVVIVTAMFIAAAIATVAPGNLPVPRASLLPCWRQASPRS
jgi:uncharacterized RDD family membrane protein YckC